MSQRSFGPKRKCFCPRSGLSENSPTIYRWGAAAKSKQSAKRTAENRARIWEQPSTSAVRHTDYLINLDLLTALKCWAVLVSSAPRKISIYLSFGKTARRFTQILVLTAVICLALTSSYAQTQRDAFSKWRPTHELAGVNYVGSAACAQCHAPLTAKRLANPMSRALAPVESCEILKTHPRLNFRNGPYAYQIVREGNRSIYTLNEGSNSISDPDRKSTR